MNSVGLHKHTVQTNTYLFSHRGQWRVSFTTQLLQQGSSTWHLYKIKFININLVCYLSYPKVLDANYDWLLSGVGTGALHTMYTSIVCVNTRFRSAVPVERVAIILWCLATPAEYRTIAHLFGAGHSTVCEIVHCYCGHPATSVHFISKKWPPSAIGYW